MKYGLVMEGGAMRGMYTCGILDVLMEQNFYPFDGAVGVSAGATFGCNYASKQPGRAIRYNLKYAKDPRYCSAASLLLTGDLYGADFDYRRLPYQLDPFDTFTFRTNPMEFWVVATDTETGEPVYRELTTMGDDDLTWMRASASMPLASRMVEIDGRTYLDGGCSDAIPLKWFESRGYGKNVVILTQPKGYRKAPQKGLPAMRVLLDGAPGIVADMERRHVAYNKTLDFIAAEEQAGRAFVFRPSAALPIQHVSHSRFNLEQVYRLGRLDAERRLPALKTFLSGQI